MFWKVRATARLLAIRWSGMRSSRNSAPPPSLRLRVPRSVSVSISSQIAASPWRSAIRPSVGL